MAANVTIKKRTIGAQFFKRTGSLISGAARDYITSAMPTITNNASEIRSAANGLRNNISSVNQNFKRLRSSATMKNIFDWYMGAADEFSSGTDVVMNYDIEEDLSKEDTSTASFSSAFVEQSNANTNKLASAIVNSSMRLAESQQFAMADVTTSIQNLNASVTSGFQTTNTLLSNILEVLTKNTATLIETNLANSGETSATEQMVRSGRFSLGTYKKIIGENIKSDPILGLASAVLPMMKTITSTGPDGFMNMAFEAVVKRVAPDLDKTLKGIDEAVSDGIMRALINLGSSDNRFARLFGINARRKSVDTSNDTLELKQVPFDSLTKEAITGAIPGYLRKILVALGGEDTVYDYRSRQFITRRAVRANFQKASAPIGGLNNASAAAKRTFGNDAFGQMVYDLMLADMGGNTGNKQMIAFNRSRLSSPESAVEYMMQLLGGGKFSKADTRRLQQIASNLSHTDKTGVVGDMEYQAARRNLDRSSSLEAYIQEARQYQTDLSGFTDTIRNELSAIRKQYGRTPDYGQTQADISARTRIHPGKGLNYTNYALYSIYKRLDTGLNVYVSGMGDDMDSPYPTMGDYLEKPEGMRTKAIKRPTQAGVASGKAPSISTDPNELVSEVDEYGNPLSAGEKFKNWGKRRGKQLWDSFRKGDSKGIYQAISESMNDLTMFAANKGKEGLQKLNDSFGNVTGYLRHKFTGKGYSYMDGDKEVVVKDNESGGIFGALKDEFTQSFDTIKNKSSSWFSRVASYFDYGDDKDKDGKGNVVNKRKRFIAASVGAFAGMGLLGGPIGLIMGAVAGNALSGLDIKGKITKLLFGYDEDEEGNAKPTGIISKFADTFITPLKFQLDKTLSKGAKVIEKKVIGPLSDIGYAIKERAARAADATFGRAFRFIGKMITAPFRGIGKGLSKMFTGLFQGAVNLFGGAARGAINTAGGISGGVLGTLASMIAPKEARQGLKDRREARNRNIDEAYDSPDNVLNMKYKDYRQRERNKNKRRITRMTDKEITAEQYMTEEEIKQHSEDISENTAQMKESQEQIQTDIADLTKHALTTDGEHSIFTHDEGVHRYLERIIDIMNGDGDPGTKPINTPIKADSPEADIVPRAPRKMSKKERESLDITDADDFANSIVSGISAIGSANGTFTTEEAELVKKATMESSKNDSDRDTMEEYMIKMVDEQAEKGNALVQKEEEEESWIDKLINGIGSGFIGLLGKALPWILGALGLTALLDVDWEEVMPAIKTAINGIATFTSNIWTGVKNFLEFLGIDTGDGGTSRGDDAGDAGVNLVLSGADTAVNDKTDLVNPKKPLVHLKTDAAGNDIINNEATEARNSVMFTNPLIKEKVRDPFVKDLKTAWKTRGAKSATRMADSFQAQADAASAAGDRAAYNKYQGKADKYRDRAAKKNAEAADLQKQKDELSGSATRNYRRNLAKVVGIDLAGTGVNMAVSAGARALGADEEQARVAGDVVQAGGTAAVIINEATSAAKNKKSWIDKILDAGKELLEYLGDKLKTSNALKKLANSKVASTLGSKIDNLIGALGKCLNPSNFVDDIWNLATKLLAKVGINVGKQLSTYVSLGISAGIAAIIGGISGNLGTEYLFQIPPGTADTLMAGISTAFGAVFSALEFVPYLGFAMVLFDVFDALALSMFKKSIKQFLAQGLYEIFAPKDEEGNTNLDVQQSAMQAQIDHYNSEWGTDLGVAEMNDMVNRTGLLDWFWKGKTQYDEEGYYRTDAAGGMINNGAQQWFVGGEKRYVIDPETGKALQKEDGTPVRAVDQYGNKLKVDMTWGDHVGNALSNFGKLFVGTDVYKTGDDNVALVDEKGDYVVDHYQKGLFQHVGDAWGSAFNAVKNFGSQVVSGFTDDPEEAQKKGGIAAAVSTGFNTMKNLFMWPVKQITGIADSDEANTDYSIGDDGEIKESKSSSKTGAGAGRSDVAGETKKKGIGGLISGALNMVKNLFLGPSKAVSDTVKDENKAQYETDEDGKPIEITEADGKTKKKFKKGDYAGILKTGLNVVAVTATDPLSQMSEAAAEWKKNDAPWIKDRNHKSKTVGDWIKSLMTDFWSGFAGDVQNFTTGGSAGSTGAGRGGIGGPDLNKFGIGGPGKVNRTFSNTRHNPTGYKFGIGAPIDANGDVQPYSPSNPYSGSLSMNFNVPSNQGGNPLSKEYYVTSGFQTPDRPDHNGIDIAPMDGSGEAEITATYKGKVRTFKRTVPDDTDDGSTMGNYLILDVTNPGQYGPDIIRYYHMRYNSLPSGISEGATVNVGDKIGDVGNTGASSGPHLHYQFERLDENGNSIPFNPLSDIQGHPEANPPRGSSISMEDGAFNGEENKTYSGPLAELLAKLSEIGTNFLNTITLGLFGNSSSSSSGSLSSSTTFNFSGDVMTLDKFLQICEREVGQSDNPAGSNNVKYNTWYYGTKVESFDGDRYNWDTTFVQWCFNEAGYSLEFKTGNAKNLLTQYKRNMPDKIVDKPDRGDIAIINDRDTRRVVAGIIYNASSGSIGVYQGDSHNKVEKVTYDTSRVAGYIRPVDWSAIAAYPEEGDLGALFNYLRSMGFDAEAAAGILGNWSYESGNTPMSVESNYMPDFQNTYGDMNDPASYAKVAADIPKYSEYSKRVINQLINQGESLNVPYYTASDGYVYAGMGYAGWTGERAKQLLEFSKVQGVPWYTSAAQLAFANWELTSPDSTHGPNGTNVKAKVQAATTPYDAAYIFNEWFEGIPWQEKRGTAAKKIYNQYAKGGIGGPGFNVEEYMAKHGGAKMGIGGPGESKAELSAITARNTNEMDPKLRRVINKSKTAKKEKTHAQLGHGTKIQKNGKPFGLGGPDLITSTGTSRIESPNYTARHNPKRITYNPTGSLVQFDNTIPTRETTTIQNGTDLTTVTTMLGSIVQYLQAITTNTGSSVTYLDSLNNKEFIDKGLRDTISAVGKAKTIPRNNLSNGTSKMVKQLAHP